MTAGGPGAVTAEPAPLPLGARDVLPGEADELRALQDALTSEFTRWGYREVATPVLELADTVDRALDGAAGRAFRLFDDHGRVLVLRHDLTVPVARLIATRMAAHPGPVRVHYVGSVLRPPPAGKAEPAEIRQAGVELVGPQGAAADAEAIALLAGALRVCGAERARIAVGDVALTEAVLGSAGVPPDRRALMRSAAAARDLVRWRELAAGSPAGGALGELVRDLPRVRGGREVLARVAADAPAARGECDRLAETLDLLAGQGVTDRVGLDLGVTRDRPYYTGIVVEAYAVGSGAPVAAGGRYDRLAERFGKPRAAVGFGVELAELHRALAASVPGRARDGVVLVGGMDAEAAAAAAVRAAGMPVAGVDAGAADDLAREDGWRYVARRDGDGFEVLDRSDGSRRRGATLMEALRSTD